MPHFIEKVKDFSPNMHSLLVSFLLALWYNGIAGLLNHYIPNRGLTISLILMSIPLIIFLSDDGKLNELYKSPNAGQSVVASSQVGQSLPQNKSEKFKVIKPYHN